MLTGLYGCTSTVELRNMEFASLGELAPQIMVALVIVGAVVVLFREIRKANGNGAPASKSDISGLRDTVNAHTVQLDGLTKEQAEVREAVDEHGEQLRELKHDTTDILRHLTSRNGDGN